MRGAIAGISFDRPNKRSTPSVPESSDPLLEEPMNTPRWLNTTLSTLLFALTLLALQGCFIFVDRDDDDDDDDDDYTVVENAAPAVLDGFDDTWWECAFSDNQGDYYWEFQATVDDLDGLSDIAWVDVFVYVDDREVLLDDFGLLDEGSGIWGGLVWEVDSNLRCGERVDVLFQVGDLRGDTDELWLTYD